MKIDGPTAWFHWAMQLLAVCLLFAAANGAIALQANDEITHAVQQLYEQAKAAHQRGGNAAAIEKYQEIIKLAPHLVAAYNNLGMLYFNEHDYTRAAEILKRCLELNPAMNHASAMLGMSYFELGLSKKAEPLLRAELITNPTDDNVEMILALVLVDLKKYGEAASHLNSVLQRNPKNLEAWYWLRKTYLLMSDDALTKIKDIDPDSVVVHEIAGETDEGVQNYLGALVEYKRAIDMAPRQPGTHMHMANAYWHMGKWKSAQAEFRLELANDPNNCTVHWKLADAVLEANDSAEEALSELNQSLALCPKL